MYFIKLSHELSNHSAPTPREAVFPLYLYTYFLFFNLMHPHIEISLELSLVILSLHKENHLLEIPDPYLSKSGFGK